MNQDNHIVLVGLPGVGKTSIGEKLSEMLNKRYAIWAEIVSTNIKIADKLKINGE